MRISSLRIGLVHFFTEDRLGIRSSRTIGANGTTIMFFVLGIIPLNFTLIAVCLGVTGFLAGFFMVPLQTMTQQLSSEEERGRVIGLWSCGSFVGVILGNVLFLVVKRMGLASNRVFLVCGVLGSTCAPGHIRRAGVGAAGSHCR